MKRCVKYAFFFILIFSSSLYSSNFHEHLMSLPFPHNFSMEATAIFALPAHKQRVNVFFKSEEEVKKFLSESLLFSEEVVLPIMSSGVLQKTLSSLCRELGEDATKNLERMLTFNEKALQDLSLRRWTYQMIETIRKELIIALPSETIVKIYDHYFDDEPLCNREVISATMTRRFFDLDQKGKHKKLQNLARRRGTELSYRVALQRSVLLEDGLVITEQCHDLLQKGEINAVDIVGSIKENSEAKKEYENAEKNMHALFEYAGDNDIPLVIHAFEGKNEGFFYDVLKKAMKMNVKPLYIEFGHIAFITEEWVDFIYSKKEIRPLFDVNVQSNLQLSGVAIDTLRKHIAYIQHKGFPVVIGSDGRGILPRSSYKEQSALLGMPTAQKNDFLPRGALMSFSLGNYKPCKKIGYKERDRFCGEC